jgi:hypothetical protein
LEREKEVKRGKKEVKKGGGKGKKGEKGRKKGRPQNKAVKAKWSKQKIVINIIEMKYEVINEETKSS